MFEIIAMLIIIGIICTIIGIPLAIIIGIAGTKKKRQKEAKDRQRQLEEDELRRLQIEKLRCEMGQPIDSPKAPMHNSNNKSLTKLDSKN